MLKQRVLTGALLSLVIIAIMLLSGNSVVMNCVAVFLSIAAAWELCRVGGYLKNKVFTFGCLAVAVLLTICADEGFAGVLLLAALAGALYLMKHIQDVKTLPEGLILLVTAVCGYFFGLLPALRSQQQGIYLLAMAVLIPVVTDVGAFCFGKAFGKHKLAPVISPKKTWEGSVGGSACTVILFAAVFMVLQHMGLVQIRVRLLVLYLLSASVISQIGDLTFSTLKRIAGVKDYGTLLPGHGGILDRFDSLLFVIPFTLWIHRLCGLLV